MSFCCIAQRASTHRNIITDESFSIWGSDYCFRIVKGTLYIIDIRCIPKKCVICGCDISIILYGKPPNIRASCTELDTIPVSSYDLNLKEFTRMVYYDVPNFGTFLISSNNYYYTDYFMIYHPLKRIIKAENERYNFGMLYMVDNEVVVCCMTKDNKIILVNSAGEIVLMETIHTKTDDNGNLTINTPYGQLIGNGIIGKYTIPDFTFISASKGLNTKPAIRPADD